MTIPLVLTVGAKREVLAIIQAAQTLAFPAADLLALPTFEAALARPAEETARRDPARFGPRTGRLRR
jgi:hypothetical protein